MSVHSIHRVYHAVVYGNLKEDEGFVESGSDATRGTARNGRPGRERGGGPSMPTRWQVLERCGNFTYIACN